MKQHHIYESREKITGNRALKQWAVTKVARPSSSLQFGYFYKTLFWFSTKKSLILNQEGRNVNDGKILDSCRTFVDAAHNDQLN